MLCKGVKILRACAIVFRGDGLRLNKKKKGLVLVAKDESESFIARDVSTLIDVS